MAQSLSAIRPGDDHVGNKVRRRSRDERRLSRKSEGEGDKLSRVLYRRARHSNEVFAGHTELDFVVCNGPPCFCAEEGTHNVMCIRATHLELAVVILPSCTWQSRRHRHCKCRLVRSKSLNMLQISNASVLAEVPQR